MSQLTACFLTVLNMTVMAIPVILVLFCLRLLLKRAPRGYSYVLWAAAGFRLLCPVALPASNWSLFNLPILQQTSTKEALALTERAVNTGTQAVRRTVERIQMAEAVTNGAAPAASTAPAAPALSWNALELASLIWAAGLFCVLLWTVFRLFRLRRRTAAAVRVEDSVWESDQIPGPFVLGLLRPKIFLPCGLEGMSRQYVLAHERYHIRRRDPWVKALSVLLLAIHWFNPAVWLALRAMERDMELSCDEAVLRQMGAAHRQDYSRTLLALGANRRDFGPVLAFGTPAVKQRIVHALAFHKAGRATIAVALAVLLAAGLTCCTDAAAGGWIKADANGDTFTYALPQGTKSVGLYVAETEGTHVLNQQVMAYGDGLTHSGSFRLTAELDGPYVLWDWEAEEPRTQLITEWTHWDEDAEVSTGFPAEQLELTLDQPAQLVTLYKTQSDGSTASLSFYLYPSSLSGDETMDLLSGAGYAQRLYDARVTYIGNHVEVGRLLGIVQEKAEYCEGTMELFTSEEPYGLAVHLYQPSNWTGSSDECAQRDHEAVRSGILMLALVDNAGYYVQTFGDDVRLDLTVEEAENLLDISDLKAYGQSVEGVSELLDLIETTLPVGSTMAAEAVPSGDNAYYLVTDAESDQAHIPCIILYDDGQFSFSYDLLSSYVPYGTWTETAGKLQCVTQDGQYHYTFLRVDEQTLQFVQAESSSVEVLDRQLEPQIQDGALFVIGESAQVPLDGLYTAEEVLQSGELVDQYWSSIDSCDVYLLEDYQYYINRETGNISAIVRTEEAQSEEPPEGALCPEEEADAIFWALQDNYFPEIDTAYAQVERIILPDGGFSYQLNEVQGDTLVNTYTLWLDPYGQLNTMGGTHNTIEDFAGTDWFSQDDIIQRTLNEIQKGTGSGEDALTFSGVTSREDMEALTVRKVLKDGRVYWQVTFQAVADQDGLLYELVYNFDAKTGVRDVIGWSTVSDTEET